MTLSLASLSAVPSSPRTQMNARISAAVAAGSISSADQTALSTALDSIDETLASSTPSGSPASMKDKVALLVDQQVDAGTLTKDQAAELKKLFTQGTPPPAADDGATDGDATDGISSSVDQRLAAMEKFLEKLRQTMDASGTYGGSSGASSSPTTGLVFSGVA